jgi:hypothetical protein
VAYLVASERMRGAQVLVESTFILKPPEEPFHFHLTMANSHIMRRLESDTTLDSVFAIGSI